MKTYLRILLLPFYSIPGKTNNLILLFTHEADAIDIAVCGFRAPHTCPGATRSFKRKEVV